MAGRLASTRARSGFAATTTAGSGPLAEPLLRKPGGSKGFGAIVEGVDARHLAVANRDDLRPLHIHRKPTLPPLTALPGEDHDAAVGDSEDLVYTCFKGDPELAHSDNRRLTPSKPRYVWSGHSRKCVRSLTTSRSKYEAKRASMSPRSHASQASRAVSTFSCDIAYSDTPAASRASDRARYAYLAGAR